MNIPRLVNDDKPPRVGQTLQSLRKARSLSLEELSRRSGVSKSMLSQVERNLANPTIALVWRLANALGVSINDLLGIKNKAIPLLSLVPSSATPSLRSSDGKCELRILGPLESAGLFEWYELTLQPEGVLESQPHEGGAREHLTVSCTKSRSKYGTRIDSHPSRFFYEMLGEKPPKDWVPCDDRTTAEKAADVEAGRPDPRAKAIAAKKKSAKKAAKKGPPRSIRRGV